MRRHLVAALIGTAALLLGGAGAKAEGRPGKKTIGLALYSSPFAMHETPDGKLECPDGLQHSNKENWELQYPTEADKNAFNEARVHLSPHGNGGQAVPLNYLMYRGPQGQVVLYNPELFKDLPLREVQSKVAYGMNLDGTSDGRATANTCKHEKFADAEGGAEAVDNQLYRVYGCSQGWRKGGFINDRRTYEVRTQVLNRVLLEISDVDDEKNDPEVIVTSYKGIDRIEVDGDVKPVPGLMQRIDVRHPKYTVRTRGKIVDGVLYTEPVDIRMPLMQIQTKTERFMRGMRLELKLTPTGAEGLMAGYENLKEWWLGHATSWGRGVDLLSPHSAPAMWEAANRLADGYPDPKTGQCRAISAAYRLGFVRAHVVQPRANDPLMINASLKAAQKTVSTIPADGS
jgi:hypothetical protein